MSVCQAASVCLASSRRRAAFPAAAATASIFTSLTPSARASSAAVDRAVRAAASASLIAASWAFFQSPSAVICSTEAAYATASAMTPGSAGRSSRGAGRSVGRIAQSNSSIAVRWRVTGAAGCVRCGRRRRRRPAARARVAGWPSACASVGSVDAAPLLRGGLGRRARLAACGVRRCRARPVLPRRGRASRLVALGRGRRGPRESPAGHRGSAADAGRSPNTSCIRAWWMSRHVEAIRCSGGHRDRAVGEDRQRRRSAQCRGGARARRTIGRWTSRGRWRCSPRVPSATRG